MVSDKSKITLADAIRLGSTLKPQAFGRAYGSNKQSSCAFFAAVDAMGGANSTCKAGEFVTGSARGNTVLHEDLPAFTIPDHWLRVTHEIRTCPECKQMDWGMYIISRHLNDLHRWDRLKIADWVEQQEKALEPERACEPEAESEAVQ